MPMITRCRHLLTDAQHSAIRYYCLQQIVLDTIALAHADTGFRYNKMTTNGDMIFIQLLSGRPMANLSRG